MSVLGFRRGRGGVMQVARQVDTLADQEQYGHAQAAEDLEVDPVGLEGKGHEQVGGAAEQEKHDPGDVQACPHRVRQGQCMAHDALDQQAITDEVAADEDQGEQPVHHGGFPFKEGFAVEGQGQATEYQAGNQGQPLAFFQLALGDEDGAVDHDRADDQHGGGAVDAPECQLVTGDINDPGVEFGNDEKQQQRDEVDELFHSKSQKLDVAA